MRVQCQAFKAFLPPPVASSNWHFIGSIYISYVNYVTRPCKICDSPGRELCWDYCKRSISIQLVTVVVVLVVVVVVVASHLVINPV